MTTITTQHIHPAMSALLAARAADESGNPDECLAQLTLAWQFVDLAVGDTYNALHPEESGHPAPKRSTYVDPAEALRELQTALKDADPTYEVPEDPASLVDTDCCQ